jgi:bacterioferritin
VATNLQTLLTRVRAEIERGAGSGGRATSQADWIRLLNAALAAAMLSVMHCRRHHYLARGMRLQELAQEFIDRSNEQLGHADLIAERIMQLHGVPDFLPGAAHEHRLLERPEGGDISAMIREHVTVNRMTIDRYRDAIDELGESDSATRHLMESILDDEEQHADELVELLRLRPALVNGASADPSRL